jgi:BTB/POZ domain
MVDIYVGTENTHWILHEKLLCAKSAFFAQIFYGKNPHGSGKGNKTFGLPEEEDAPFKLFVGWLYSGRVPIPEEENDLGDLFELYLMGEKWQIAGLVKDVLGAVRRYYRTTQTFPGLRRVQYMYANTDEASPMRQLLTSSVARMLVLGDKGSTLPAHWEKALAKNGQMAVDLIGAVRLWNLDPKSVPDAREEPQQLEKEKVKGVEEAEEHRKEDAGLANGTPHGDSEAAGGKNMQDVLADQGDR